MRRIVRHEVNCGLYKPYLIVDYNKALADLVADLNGASGRDVVVVRSDSLIGSRVIKLAAVVVHIVYLYVGNRCCHTVAVEITVFYSVCGVVVEEYFVRAKNNKGCSGIEIYRLVFADRILVKLLVSDSGIHYEIEGVTVLADSVKADILVRIYLCRLGGYILSVDLHYFVFGK